MKPKAMCIEFEIPEDELIISHTNHFGVITYVNETFARISGYEPEELVGYSHSIIRHPDMPSSVFEWMWQTIVTGKMWTGYIKNLRKDGGFYWVHAQVSPLLDKDGSRIGYKSLRTFVEREKRHQLERFYNDLKENEEKMVHINSWIEKEIYDNVLKKMQEDNITFSEILKRLY